MNQLGTSHCGSPKVPDVVLDEDFDDRASSAVNAESHGSSFKYQGTLAGGREPQLGSRVDFRGLRMASEDWPRW